VNKLDARLWDRRTPTRHPPHTRAAQSLYQRGTDRIKSPIRILLDDRRAENRNGDELVAIQRVPEIAVQTNREPAHGFFQKSHHFLEALGLRWQWLMGGQSSHDALGLAVQP
jgi:hypothetical protein